MHLKRGPVRPEASLLFFCCLWSMSSSLPFGTAASLYKDTDPITQLGVLDFKSTILATSNAWLIEFYSSWCGHCIDFAPAFIQLANDVKGWEKVIKVGAIDCAKDENIPLCREYEVMGYPTIKFFPSFSEASQLGIPWKGTKKVENIRHSMVDFVESQYTEKKAAPHWPVLGTLKNETLDDLWAHYNNQEIILLFEQNDHSYWSREAILDAYQFSPNYPPIRRVDATRPDLIAKYNVNSFPAFVFLERTGKAELYQIQPSREFLAKVMRKFFDNEGHEATVRGGPAAPHVPDAVEVNQKSGKTPVKDQVYMADLEGALLYAFGHEVAIHKNIAGNELIALQAFVRVLDGYFPGRKEIMDVVRALRRKLEDYTRNIKGEEFAQIWQEALGGRLFKEWVGCKGSKPHLRGYPCSLWTTFHTLTVSYALKEPKENPAFILHTMKGYIKYFFGCAHCSNHFVDMAEDESNPIESVKSPQAAVLWLWAAHNKVNRRIASDASEDPAAPKIQFPSEDNCPGCLSSEEASLSYLMRLYSPDSISSAGLSDPEIRPASSGSLSVHNIQIGTLSFTSYDISLAAMIYFVSSIILMLVLCHMLVKKRRVRKHVYDLISGKF